jgi:dephospho-CoA kinase
MVIKKIQSQWDDEKKIPLADYVFINSSKKANILKVKNLITYFNSIFK